MSWIDDTLSGIPVNAVLRDSLTLAAEKFAVLETKNSVLTEQNSVLVSKNQALQLQLDKAKQEIAILKQQIESHNSAPFEGPTPFIV